MRRLVEPANLALKFLLELAAIAALAYWGASVGTGAVSVAVAIAAPLAAILLWGRFAAPRSRQRLPARTRVPFELAIFGLAAVALAGCGRGDPAAGGAGAPGGAFPPAPVKTVMMSAKPVPQASEFVAIIESLRSTTIQPQVEGFIRRIFVKSGDRVRAGQALVQIDADKQAAAVSSLESPP